MIAFIKQRLACRKLAKLVEVNRDKSQAYCLNRARGKKSWAMRQSRRSGLLRTEPISVVSALREPAAIAEVRL